MARPTKKPSPPHPHVAWLLEQLPQGVDLGARCFVLTSTAAAAACLRREVIAQRPALLGVRFTTPATFVRELLLLLGLAAPDETITPLEERALLRQVLRDRRGDVAGYALRHRTSLLALASACREWQRAGASPHQGALSAWADETVRIAAAWRAALLSSPRGGRSQDLARALAALQAGTLPRVRLRVLQVGAPDTRDFAALLTALAQRTPQFGFAVAPTREPHAARATRSSHPHPEAELRAAANRCALAFAQGERLDRLVLAAPRLGPYVPYLAGAFAQEGVPVQARTQSPLTAEPRGALAAHAVRLLFAGAPARSYLALAGSTLQARPLPAWEHRLLEETARQVGLAGAQALPDRVVQALAEKAPRASEAIARLCEQARAAQEAHTPLQKTAALAKLLGQELRAPEANSRDAQAHELLGEVLRELRFATGEEFALDALETLRDRGLAIGNQLGEAVQVAEYADALAFPCTQLTLLGAADDQLPTASPAPTFFGEADRAVLGLATRTQWRQHEREQFAALTAHADVLHVSRPLSDGQGQEVGPSPLLEQSEQLAAVAESSERAHPLPRAAARIAAGLVPVDVAVVHVALSHGSAAAASRLLGARGALGLKRVQLLERFAGELSLDGDVGRELAVDPQARTPSVSDLETLAKCAQQFLFKRLLNLRAMPPEPDALALAPNAVGSAVHALLADLRPRLAQAAASPEPVDVAALSAELLPDLDRRLTETSPLAHTLPALHKILVKQWARAVAASFAQDAASLRAYGITPLYGERKLEGDLSLGDGRTLRVQGRADRIDALADGSLRIVDYKTGRRPEAVLSPTDILKGRSLQMPAYAAIAAQSEGKEAREFGVQAVHPDWGADAEHWLKWRSADDFLAGRYRQGLQETLRVLVDVREQGSFVPSMDAQKVCRFCDFRAACRRLHPPSRERVYHAKGGAVERYLGLRSKSHRMPLLGGGDDGQ